MTRRFAPWLFVLCLSGSVAGQEPEVQPSDALIRTDDRVPPLFLRVDAAAGERRWADAARDLAGLLAKYPDVLFEEAPGLYRPVRDVAAERARAWPAEGRDALRAVPVADVDALLAPEAPQTESPEAAIPEDTWPMLGGDSGRSRAMSPSLDLSSGQWVTDIPGGSAPPRKDPSYMMTASPDSSAPPCCFPVVEDGIVYFHNEVQVFAYELQATYTGGRRLWVYPRVGPQMEPKDVIFSEDALLGSTLANGRLFVNLAGARQDFERQLEWLDIKVPTPIRALIALDAGSGRLLWRIGGQRRGDQVPFADQASFAQSPAVAGIDLYVGAVYVGTNNGPIEHYLCKIDARTGELAWRTMLCAGFDAMNLLGNPAREAVGTPVTLWRDTAVYGTNLGVIAAVNVRTGGIRWLKRYRQFRIGPTRDLRGESRHRGWANNPILQAGGRLFVAPIDSPDLMALDCATGRELWRHVRNAAGNHTASWEWERFLIGIQRDQVIGTGTGCFALDAATGELRWDWRPEAQERIQGRGACTRDHIYVPTDTHLVRLNPDGSASASFPWSGSDAGNVLIADHAILSATPHELKVYFDLAAYEKSLRQELAAHPDEPGVHYRLGIRRQSAEDADGAVTAFYEAAHLGEKRGDPDSLRVAERARRALGRLQFDQGRRSLLGGDRARAVEQFAQARAGAVDEAAIVDLAFETAALLAESKAYAEAVAPLQEVIEKHPDATRDDGRTGDIARREIDRLLAAAGRAAYAPVEERARALLQAGDLPEVIRRFPNSLACEEALLAMAQRALADGQYDEARRRLEALLERGEGECVPEGYRRLIECREKLGAWSAARGLLGTLLRRFPDAQLTGVSGAVSVKDFVAERLRRPEYVALTEAGARRELGSPLHAAWTWSEVGAADVRLLAPGGKMPRDAADLVFVACRETVRALRWNTGEEVWRAKVERGVGSSAFFEQNVIVCGSTTVSALAAKSGGELWRAQFDDLYVQESCIADGTLYLDAGERVDQSLKRVIAVEAASGRTLWSFPYRKSTNDTDLLYLAECGLIVPTSPDHVSILDRDRGTVTGTIDLQGRYGRLLLTSTHGLLALGSHFNSLSCFDPVQRSLKWMQDSGSILRDSLLANQSVIAFLERDAESPAVNYLVVMDPERGKRLAHSMLSIRDYPQSQTVIDDHAIYVTFRDCEKRDRVFVSAFSLQTGARGWTCAREPTGSLTLCEPILAGSLVLLNAALYDRQTNRWTSVTMVIRCSDGSVVQEISPEAPAGAGAAVTVVENGVFAVIQGGTLFAYLGEK